MSKHFKKKKKIKYKSLFKIIIFTIIICFLFNTFGNVNLFNVSSMKISNIFNNPELMIKKELNLYKTKKLSKNSNTKSNTFNYIENEEVLVYIYNSHQGEKYAYEYLEDYNIIPDVKMVAHMIEDNLKNIGIKCAVEDADILSYMKEKNYNHAQSYIASRIYLEEAVKKYPAAKLYIDLHRDAATHSVTHTTIDGKDYAKVLFVVGLENPNYKKNLQITENINNIIKNKYPTLTRGIMQKKGPGVNGVYNQDVNENVILLEIGGNENNIEEINNTSNLISKVIGEYINEEEKK